MGIRLQEEPLSLPPFSHRGVCTEIFSTFLFFVSEGWDWGRREWDSRGLGAWSVGLSVHLSPPLMLSQCFFSLSFELVLRYPTRRPGPSHARGASGKKTGCPARARLRRGHPATQPTACCLVCLIIDSCCPALWGLSVWGEGSCLETVPRPRPPTPEMPVPAPPPPDPPPRRTEDSGGHRGTSPAGPPRLKLY